MPASAHAADTQWTSDPMCVPKESESDSSDANTNTKRFTYTVPYSTADYIQGFIRKCREVDDGIKMCNSWVTAKLNDCKTTLNYYISTSLGGNDDSAQMKFSLCQFSCVTRKKTLEVSTIQPKAPPKGSNGANCNSPTDCGGPGWWCVANKCSVGF